MGPHGDTKTAWIRFIFCTDLFLLICFYLMHLNWHAFSNQCHDWLCFQILLFKCLPFRIFQLLTIKLFLIFVIVTILSFFLAVWKHGIHGHRLTNASMGQYANDRLTLWMIKWWNERWNIYKFIGNAAQQYTRLT